MMGSFLSAMAWFLFGKKVRVPIHDCQWGVTWYGIGLLGYGIFMLVVILKASLSEISWKLISLQISNPVTYC